MAQGTVLEPADYNTLVNWLADRMRSISTPLAQRDPNAALSLATSAVPNYQIPYIAQGLTNALGLQVFGRAAVGDYLAPGYSPVGNYDLPRAPAPGAPDPNGTLRALPPELQPFGKWLQDQTVSIQDPAQRGGFSPEAQAALARGDFTAFVAEQERVRTEKPHPVDDPLDLSRYVLDVRNPESDPRVLGGGPTFVLDSSVQQWIDELNTYQAREADIAQGDFQIRQVAPAQRTAEQLGELPSLNPIFYSSALPEGKSARDVMRDGARAQALIYMLQTLHPDGKVMFRDKGTLGKVLMAQQEATNLISYPLNVGIREAGGLFGLINRAVQGGDVPVQRFATPAEVWHQTAAAQGYEWGEQFARGVGLKPGDQGYDTISGLTNFIVGWYADPLIVAGKIGAAERAAETLPLGSKIGHGLTQRWFDKIAKTPEALVDTFDTSKLINIREKVWARGENPATVISDYYGMPADTARALASAQTPGEIKANLIDGFYGTAASATPETIQSWTTEKLSLDERIADLTTTGRQYSMEYADAVQRQRLLTARLTSAVNPQAASIIRDLPQPSFWNAVKHQISKDVLEGAISRKSGSILSAIAEANIPGTRIRVSAFYHDLPVDRWLRNPFSLEARPGEIDTWAKGFDSMLKDYGVPAAERRGVTNAIITAKNREELFNAITVDAERAVKKSVDRINGALKDKGAAFSDVRPQASHPILSWFGQAGERTKGIVPTTNEAGIVSWEPTIWRRDPLPDGGFERTALPGKAIELMDSGVVLPSHADALAATGTWRRFATEHPGWGSAWQREQMIMDASTRWWKNGLLLGRAPAVLGRTQLEQAARIAAFGKASMFSRPWEWIKFMFDSSWDRELEAVAGGATQSDRLLGLIATQMERDGQQPFRRMFKWSDLKTETDQKMFANVWRTELHKFFSDPGMKMLAREGPRRFETWLRDSVEGQAYWDQFGSVLGEQMYVPEGVDRLAHFADQNYAEFQNLARGDKGILNAARQGFAVDEKASVAINEGRDLLDYASQERANAESFLAEGDPNQANEAFRHARDASLEARRKLRKAGLKEAKIRRFQEPDWGAITNEQLSQEIQRAQKVSLDSEDFNSWLLRRVNDGADALNPPPYLAGWWSDALAGSEKKGRFADRLYRWMLSNPDKAVSRAPLFRQFAEDRFQELTALGVKPNVARRQAAFWGANQARDSLYDLAGRTSAQRFFRNVAPFFPAWQEIVTTWMWKIPSRYTPAIGHVYLARRAEQLVRGLTDLGIDPTGRLPIPGLQQLLGMAFGGPDLVPSFKPKDLNLALQTNFPGLGPIPGVALGALAKSHNGVFDDVAKILMPFGLDVQLGPASLNRGFEAVCLLTKSSGDCTPPWEIASPEVQDLYFSYSLSDSMRATWVQFMQAGDKPPDPEARDKSGKPLYPNGESFRVANDEWVARLVATARHRAAGVYGIRAALSFLAPAPIQITDKTKKDLNSFYDQLGAVAKRSPEAAAMYDDFLAQHPYADLYLTPSSIKDSTLKPDAADNAFQQILQGQRTLLSQEDFANLGLGLYSRRLYEKMYLAELGKIGDAPDLLRNWAGRNDAQSTYLEAMDRYEKYNPDFAASWQRLLDGSSLPPDSLEVQRLKDFATQAKILAEDQFATDGVPGIKFRSLAGQITAALVDTYGPAQPGSITEKLNWYFDKGPGAVLKQMDSIWADAKDSPTSAELGSTLDQIRHLLNNQTEMKGPDGQSYPTVEAFLWGAKDPEQKQDQLLRWALRPPEWLTRYERTLVYGSGYQNPKIDDFMDFANDTQHQVNQIISQSHLSSSSTDAINLHELADRAVKTKANQMGLGRIIGFINQTPAQQLQGAGQFADVPGMDKIFSDSAQIAKFIEGFDPQNPLSAKGHSKLADALKQPYYLAIDAMREKNSQLDQAWWQLQDAMLSGDRVAVKHDAYDFILFGQTYGILG